MRLNEHTAVATSRVLLVPYETHHVAKYHGWMQDPRIQEATASEPLSLEEEDENQRSWRTARDKLTFIVCEPLAPSPSPDGARRSVGAREADGEASMRGDVNVFLHGDGDGTRWLTGEVDVMVAAPEHCGRGLGGAAVCALLAYLQRHQREMLEEHGGPGGEGEGRAGAGGRLQLRRLVAKIREGNAPSRALFHRLGFRREGGVNYFGEVTMAMAWDEAEARVDEWLRGGEAEGYREMPYVR